MNKDMRNNLQRFWDAIESTMNKYDVLWHAPIRYSMKDSAVIRRGHKFVMGAEDEQKAKELADTLEAIQWRPECMRYEKRKNKEPGAERPFPLIVHKIHAPGIITLSKTPVTESVHMSLDALITWQGEVLRGEMLALQAELDTTKSDDAKEFVRQKMKEAQQRHDANCDAMRKKLNEHENYRVTHIKPEVYAYRLTYFDPDQKRRCQISVGDIVIALGCQGVRLPLPRKARMDRLAVRPDVIMTVSHHVNDWNRETYYIRRMPVPKHNKITK